jgi:hypothetical protein
MNYLNVSQRRKTMPNWCNNSITISGSTETIETLWEEASKDDSGLLQAMVPMPKDLDGTTSPSDLPNWYDWRVTNWGTKWDVDLEGLEFTNNHDGTSSITGWFDSAWAPPIEAYNTFLDDMDGCSIHATYEEGGMDFAGIYEDGEDQGMDDISEWCRAVIKGTTSLEDTPELFQKLDEEFELIENRREYIEEEMAEESEA